MLETKYTIGDKIKISNQQKFVRNNFSIESDSQIQRVTWVYLIPTD